MLFGSLGYLMSNLASSLDFKTLSLLLGMQSLRPQHTLEATLDLELH